ncbi:MAG: hypothetical protein BGO41_05495 [Clostridiales bacterium 38-18]|nr:MAG: hypothetical protein BGO41_05495 [Clostridiales bacterium 38-18]
MSLLLKFLVVFIFFLVYTICAILITNRNIDDEYKLSKKDRMILITLGILVFLITYFTNTKLIYSSFAFYWLILIAFLDHRSHSIYHWMLLVSFVINLVIGFTYNYAIPTMFVGFGIGFLLYLAIYVIALISYKREVFGFGDVMLMGSLGLLLGIKGTLITSILTFYVAILGIAILYLRNRNINKKTEVAFAPYMILSAILVALFEHQIIELYRSIFMI